MAIAVAAILALPSVILVMMYGQTRVFFVMARDGLLPKALGKLSANHAPVRLTLITGVVVALVGGFLPLDQIAELSNAGTLLAFICVAVCVMVLRKTRPDLPRLFRCPAVWIVAPLAVVGCLYFMVSLPVGTLLRFAGWNAIGLVVYLLYSRRTSLLAKGVEAPPLKEAEVP